MSAIGEVRPEDVVAFWENAGPEKWYAKDEAFDAEIARRFASTHAAAAEGSLAEWAETPEGALALLLLLDQFSRNLFRGSARTFAQDPAARRIAHVAIEAGLDMRIAEPLRQFFYLPFMHSEAIADQERCVRLSHALQGRDDTLPYAIDHERIIRRFGRFPHRNAILGRHNSPAEADFLAAGGFAG